MRYGRTLAWTTDDADAWIEWGGPVAGGSSAAELVAAEAGGASLMVAGVPPRDAGVRLGLFGHDRPIAATIASTTPLERFSFDSGG
jgi:hypothetical protein